MGDVVQTRSDKAGVHLSLLRSLSGELDKAMGAIAQNHLEELEASIARQQELSSELSELADDVMAGARAQTVVCSSYSDPNLAREIRAAQEQLRLLNLRYSMLLEHSSRSVALMASLFSSCKGEYQEASGPRLKHQTWSCQM